MPFTDADIIYFDEPETTGLSGRDMPTLNDQFREQFPGIDRSVIRSRIRPIRKAADIDDIDPKFHEWAQSAADKYSSGLQGTDIDASRNEFIDSLYATRLNEMSGVFGANTHQFANRRLSQSRMGGTAGPSPDRGLRGREKPNATVGTGMQFQINGKPLDFDENGHAIGYWNGKLDRR